MQLSLPETLQYPTVRPWYESTPAPPAPPGHLTELEYRTCAGDNICSSYLEMGSASCREEICSEDFCNRDFQKDGQILIIVLAAAVSLVVCVAMVTLICCWYFKIRPRKDKNYRPVPSKKRPSIRQSFMVKFKVGFVRTEVVKIEEKSECCSSRAAQEMNKDKKHAEKGNFKNNVKAKVNEKGKGKEKSTKSKDGRDPKAISKNNTKNKNEKGVKQKLLSFI